MDAGLELLYCDAVLAVCVKPPGVLSEPAREANLPALLAESLRSRGEQDAVFTVHRLDREVGGLAVLARTHEAASSLIAQFAGHTVEKEYCAVVRGRPGKPRAVWEDLLFRDAAKNKSYVVTRPRRGVRSAKLEYALLGEAVDGAQPLSLVRIRLFTGRTHQIRVQFASRALPLLGDGRYGGRDARCQIALFSCRLAFDHPVTGKRLCFERRPPSARFPWNAFPAGAYPDASPFFDAGGTAL